MRYFSPFFLLGFSLPFLKLALEGNYLKALLLLFKTSLSFNFESLFPTLGLISLFLLASNRNIFFLSFLSLTILPSIIFLISIIFGSLDLGKEIYLLGLSSLFIILPLLLFINLINEVIKGKGSVTLPIFLSLLCYTIIALVNLSYTEGKLSSLGINLITNLVISISSFIYNFTSLPTSYDTNLRDPYLWSLFALTSLLYFYYRLYNPTGRSYFLIMALTIISSLLITLALIYLDVLIRLPLLVNLNLSMIILLIILWLALPKK